MGRTGRSHKGKRSEEGQYVPLTYGLLKSVAWRSLSGAAVKVYLELHTRFNGSNNGQMHLSYSEAQKALGMGKATVQRAYAELQEKGFLALQEEGNWYNRRAHEWRLTTKGTMTARGTQTPTNDWRLWKPKTERGSETEPSPVGMVPKRNPSAANGSISEPVRGGFAQRFGSETEH